MTCERENLKKKDKKYKMMKKKKERRTGRGSRLYKSVLRSRVIPARKNKKKIWHESEGASEKDKKEAERTEI